MCESDTMWTTSLDCRQKFALFYEVYRSHGHDKKKYVGTSSHDPILENISFSLICILEKVVAICKLGFVLIRPPPSFVVLQ